MQEDYEEIFKEWAKAFLSVLCAFILLLLMCLICGCRTTKYVPMETVRTEYLRTDSSLYTSILKMLSDIERSKHTTADSLIHRIKETTRLNADGDTVGHTYIEYVYMSSKEKAEYEKTIRERDDSIGRLNLRLESAKTDSVSVPYPVERKLSKWEKTKMDFGGIMLGAVGVLLIALAILAWIVLKRRK